LTPQDLEYIDHICVDFSKSGHVPSKNTSILIFKKLVREKSKTNKTKTFVTIEE
jgi:hypothetical protein